jgi:hypothetical protein
MTTTTTRNWRDMVLEADKDFEEESKHPIVYKWPEGHERRDPGADGGPYANPVP